MGFSLLPVGDLDPRAVAAWRRLADRAAEPNPFFEADYVLAAARHLDSARVSLAVVTDGDDWLACVPVERRWRWRWYPGRWVVTWRHVYCFLGTPLVDRSCVEPALERLMEGLSASGRGTWTALEWLAGDGRLRDALGQVLDGRRARTLGLEGFERATLLRRPEATYLEETLKPSRRKELRRLQRRLEDELGEPAMLEERAGDPAAYEEFMRLEASGWKGRRGTALAADEAHAAFFRDVCSAFAAQGRLQLLRLGTPERAVAMQCNLLAGDTLFCFKVAYDEGFARWSPGVQLELRAVEVFHERHEVRLADSCADPDNELINRLWPDRRPISTLVVPPTGPLRRVSLRAVRATTTLRGQMHAARANIVQSRAAR
jgi:CelD/BcsL family acetyltransferase involved in cellulose biosynthesis